MNLTTTPTEVLNMMFDLAKVSTHEDSSEIMFQISQELERRSKTETNVKTGFRIELRMSKKDKWADVKDTYFGSFHGGVNRFFPTVEAAQQAVNRLNKDIKGGYYDYWTENIKPEDIRFVRITTIRESGV